MPIKFPESKLKSKYDKILLLNLLVLSNFAKLRGEAELRLKSNFINYKITEASASTSTRADGGIGRRATLRW
jgi:hypothetical protein